MDTAASKVQLYNLYFRLCSLWHLIVVRHYFKEEYYIGDIILVWNE